MNDITRTLHVILQVGGIMEHLIRAWCYCRQSLVCYCLIFFQPQQSTHLNPQISLALGFSISLLFVLVCLHCDVTMQTACDKYVEWFGIKTKLKE